jgi:hypothetical protein
MVSRYALLIALDQHPVRARTPGRPSRLSSAPPGRAQPWPCHSTVEHQSVNYVKEAGRSHSHAAQRALGQARPCCHGRAVRRQHRRAPRPPRPLDQSRRTGYVERGRHEVLSDGEGQGERTPTRRSACHPGRAWLSIPRLELAILRRDLGPGIPDRGPCSWSWGRACAHPVGPLATGGRWC